MNLQDSLALEKALSLYSEGEFGCCISSALFDFQTRIWRDVTSEYSPVAKAINNIHHDLWNAAAIAHRIFWMRGMVRQGSLDMGHWRSYSQLDIEHYFVQLRSIFDYLAMCISASAVKKGQLPPSFRALKNSISKYQGKIHPDIVLMVSTADWFDEIRAIRDGLVHEGAQPLIFDDETDSILFQVHPASGLNNMISKKYMMHNDNVAFFDRFAAWSFSHALTAIDCVGVAISEGKRSHNGLGSSRSYSPGFITLKDWMLNLQKLLSANQSSEQGRT